MFIMFGDELVIHNTTFHDTGEREERHDETPEPPYFFILSPPYLRIDRESGEERTRAKNGLDYTTATAAERSAFPSLSRSKAEEKKLLPAIIARPLLEVDQPDHNDDQSDGRQMFRHGAQL